jgi:transcriptional regulator with XRE-family HTH domain
LYRLIITEAMDITKFRMIRKGKGMSLDDIAGATGIGKGALSLIENGKSNPTHKTLEKIADALGVKLEILL